MLQYIAGCPHLAEGRWPDVAAALGSAGAGHARGDPAGFAGLVAGPMALSVLYFRTLLKARGDPAGFARL